MQLQGSCIDLGPVWIKEWPSKWAETQGVSHFHWPIVNRIIEIRAIFGALKRALGVL